MKKTFRSCLISLQKTANDFTVESHAQHCLTLLQASKTPLPIGKELIAYAEVLVFMCSHPGSAKQLLRARKELNRISKFLKEKKRGLQPVYEGSGLPFTQILTRFSHDLVSWMLQQKKYSIEFDSFSEDGTDLNEVLKLCLPALEREHTSAGYDYKELFHQLKLKPGQEVSFLVQQLDKFSQYPLLKDYLFDSLDLYIKISSREKSFSRTYNKLSTTSVFYHTELLKRFDSKELLNTVLPNPKELDSEESKNILTTIKDSLILTSRETDPATFDDYKSLRVYELERGIRIAIYGMQANRQLPLESYVGYTLFKNGYPAAYGGSWIFGKRALFGINIFEAFRGGESGFMMCQILRVYKHVFDLSYIEVEPYQFGKDNPDGINSGAYWFYHRYGFRSVDKTLHQLSEREFSKIKTIKGYRSSKKTLERFTDSYIALQLGKLVPPAMSRFTKNIPAFIQKEYKGNRRLAEDKCVATFLHKIHGMDIANQDELLILKEVSMLAAVLNINSENKLSLLKEMVKTKPYNVYEYQHLLTQFCVGF